MTTGRNPTPLLIPRRSFVGGGAATLGLLAAGRRAAAQQDRPFKIFIVTPREDVGDEQGFRAYLSSIDMKVDYTKRVTGFDKDVIAEAAREILDVRPDLVLTIFTPLTLGVAGRHDAADTSGTVRDIPIVFSSVTDPVASGVVPSLEAPARNVTGVRHLAPLETQINTIQSYRPFERLGCVYNAQENNMVATVNKLGPLLEARGLEFIPRPVPLGEDGKPDPAAIPDLVADVARAGGEFLYIGPDSFIASRNNTAVAEAALANGLPTFCATERPFQRSNVLMGLVGRAYNVGGFAGLKASRILLGDAAVAETPVETLSRFSLFIRMSVAKALDFYPPMRLLSIATVDTEPLEALRG